MITMAEAEKMCEQLKEVHGGVKGETSAGMAGP